MLKNRNHEMCEGVPGFPVTRPLELCDKPGFDRLFRDAPPSVSEFTFANLYLFRRAHDYRLAMVEGALVVLGKGYGGEPYFLPPFGPAEAALKTLFAGGMTLYGADEAFAAAHLASPKLAVAEDRNNFDYVYLREEMATLPGNRYHKKKNRISYFSARHQFTVELLAQHHLPGCRNLLDDWTRVRQEQHSGSAVEEASAAAEALQLAGELGLQGVVVLVEGDVKAFALGEKLNGDTSVCHFEKADPFMEGLYQLVDREFCRLLFTECTFVNREQDLGEPNLREAKLSYHPVRLVKKYRATSHS